MDSVGEYHNSHQVLLQLSKLDTPLGDLVRGYLDRRNIELPWLTAFFLDRTKLYQSNPSLEITLGQTSVARAANFTNAYSRDPVFLKDIDIHFFRGFRNMDKPVTANNKLVVIDGRNSSGKTSLAEAVEWLFTGKLERRESLEQGNPKELENCITNSFIPSDDKTWVSASFLVGDRTINLRRILAKDYGPTPGSKCESVLYLDGNPLSFEEEQRVLNDLFGGVAPLLMQHTLRSFVHSNPSERHAYFEKLLNVELLTELIEKAVVTDQESKQIPPSTGSLSFQKWEGLKSACTSEKSKRALKKAEKAAADMKESIRQSLVTAAKNEFATVVTDDMAFTECISAVQNYQSEVRRKSFPLLNQLRPKQKPGEQVAETLQKYHNTKNILKQIGIEVKAAEEAQTAAHKLGEANLALARAVESLKAAGKLSGAYPQTCPLCEYPKAKSLTNARMKIIESWIPAQNTLSLAQNALKESLGKIQTDFEEIDKTIKLSLPPSPSDEEWQNAEKSSAGSIASEISKVKASSRSANDALTSAGASLSDIQRRISDGIRTPDLKQFEKELHDCIVKYDTTTEEAKRYVSLMDLLENSVGLVSGDDPTYDLMDKWLTITGEVESLVGDLEWETAKKKAQEELRTIREQLIALRQDILESKRIAFSSDMTDTWKSLRCDDYSAFSKLFIPSPSGKGFHVKIEIKAVLDDGTNQQEVDALKVFSESQVHALGIAAFVTRAKMIGHKMLIFDDPVQSMDEEHFRTFASTLLRNLLDQGFQIVILTHNDTFAKLVSYAHYDREDYATLGIRHSKREGCRIEEGARRRVSERLKIAEQLADEERLEEGWRFVRRSLERLYTIVYAKYGPKDFNPISWADQTAEFMWNAGVGEIIKSKVSGKERRLKEILTLTASGAHDKSASGITDLKNAVKDLRSLVAELKVGG